MLRAQAGDGEALECILRRAQKSLLGHIRRVTGDEFAQDVLQETLLQVCLHLRELRNAEYFQAWMYRIATRAAYASLRRQSRLRDGLDEEADVELLPQEGAACDPVMAGELQRILEQLSPASRAVLSLHYFEDRTIAEVAAILGLSTGTVKSRLAYGLQQLRRVSGRKGE